MRFSRARIFSPQPIQMIQPENLKPLQKTDWVELGTRQIFDRGGLETALAASTLQHIRAGQDQERKRLAAEDELGIKALGGKIPQPTTPDSQAGRDMVGGVDLGGNSHTYNIQQPATSFGRLAGAALLAGAIGLPLSGVAWKYLDRPPAPVFEDTDTNSELVIFRPAE